MPEYTYKHAGVDLELYRQTMQRIPALLRRTFTPRVLELEGGFAGLFQLNDNKPGGRRYENPVLVSGTDGVGTKIKVAALAGRYDTIGIDLVAMCVNDCLCLGAEPLFFLDYLALSRDDPLLVEQLVRGVSEGCRQAGTALLGGETAIMPDLYAPGDFDMAGFCVGVAERGHLVDGRAIRPGDCVLGLGSSGFHSNGYSLVRKVVFEAAGLDAGAPIPELDATVADALLTPTLIYARPVCEILRQEPSRQAVHGMAHITGGGLAENLHRIVPENCRAVIRPTSWEIPAVYGWFESLGGVKPDEMWQVFNMGIGYCLVVAETACEEIHGQLAGQGVRCWKIGDIQQGTSGVELAR